MTEFETKVKDKSGLTDIDEQVLHVIVESVLAVQEQLRLEAAADQPRESPPVQQ